MPPEAEIFPWYAIPVTIASILIPLLIFVAVVYLWNKAHNQKCPNQVADCTEAECNKLVKKNFNHLVVLFVVIFVFVIVDLFIDDKDAMDYFSFASTITSIILSVLAIIMTISSENKTEGMKRQIDDSVHKLEESSNRIQLFREELDQNSKQQQEIFESILHTSQELKKEIINLKADVKDVKNNMLNQERIPPKENYLDDEMKIYLPQTLPQSYEDESYENNW